MDYKELFYKDSVEKQVKIYSADGTVNITNKELKGETMELSESICNEKQLKFGSCSASMLTFTVSDVSASMTGKWLNVDIGLITDDAPEDAYQLGRYQVNSDKPTSDRTARNVIAYDALYDVIKANVATWYNALLPDKESTVNLKQFRDSFFIYFGIEQEEITLVNDNMLVERTILPSEMSGGYVINCICEINGCFGRIGRNGKFEYIYLSPIASAEDVNEITKDKYITADYEDVIVKTIDKLQIRKNADDVGKIVGEGTNAYIIEDNFLVYGKSTEELTQIANNIFSKIQGLTYRPFTSECIGNPCIQPGDIVRISTKYETIESYVLSRTLKGVQSFKDAYESKGTELRSEQLNSTNHQLKQLMGKSNELERKIEQNQLTISDVEKGLKDQITQNAEKFSVELEALQAQVDGDIKQYNVDYEPTLTNYPAWDFTYNIPCNDTVQVSDDLAFIYKDSYYSRNARTIVFDKSTSTTYRFVNEDGNWFWKAIGDTEYGIAMSKIASLEVTTENISSSVSSLDYKITNEYITTEKCNALITLSSNSIKQEVSAEYAKKSLLDDYSTTVKMNAAIKLAADGIKQTVSETYATKTALGDYSTTTQMNTAIEQSAKSIKQTVSKTYATQTSLSETKQLADKINWLVKSGDSSANMVLTPELYKVLADNIILSGKHIQLDGDTTVGKGFKLSCDVLNGGIINGQTLNGCTMQGGAISIGGNNIIMNEAGLWIIGNESAQAPAFMVNNLGQISQYSGGIRRFFSNGHMVTGTVVTSDAQYSITSNWYSICQAGNNTSDKRQKNTIKPLNEEEKMESFFDNLKPCSFFFNKGTGYIETQKHIGFIAQDIEEDIKVAGFEEDLAVFDHLDEEKLGINKQEIIALNTWQIQKLKSQLKSLMERMTVLESGR